MIWLTRFARRRDDYKSPFLSRWGVESDQEDGAKRQYYGAESDFASEDDSVDVHDMMDEVILPHQSSIAWHCRGSSLRQRAESLPREGSFNNLVEMQR